MKWSYDKLGNLTDIISGTTPNSEVSSYWNGSHVWVTPTDLGKLQGTYITSSQRKVSDLGLKSCNLSIVPKNSVVMSSRAPIGHLGIAATNIYTNQGCKSFVCGSKLDPLYLYYYLKYCMRQIQILGSGSTFSEVSKSLLEEFEIRFPDSLEAQQRIANNLRTQFDEIVKATKAAKLKKEEVKRFSHKQQERVLEILNDSPRVPLSEYLEAIEAGKSIKTTELPAKKDELGVLKVSAVSWVQFQPDEAKSVIGNYNPPDSHKVKKGDVIITRANGTLRLVGAGVFVEDDYPNRLLSDKTLRLKLKSEKILPKYLLHILRLPEARKYIEENATGSQSMRNISQKTIYGIPVPQAEELLQQEIIQLIEGSSAQLNKINTALDAVLKDLNILSIKLLQEAFEIE